MATTAAVSLLVMLSLICVIFGAKGDAKMDDFPEDIDFSVDNTVSMPEWTYKCMQDKGCQRFPQNTANDTLGLTYSSPDLCRLTCGRFAGLWPKPYAATLSPKLVRIHPKQIRIDLIDSPPATREMLAEMGQIFTSNLMLECKNNVTVSAEVAVVIYVNVKSEDLRITWETDEEYTLDMQIKGNSMQVKIAAETVYGARHALETLSQLAAPTIPIYSTYRQSCGLMMVNAAKIRDKPKYPHRGLVLDTARHFVPVRDILRQLDGMAASKMNVFHWHATDTQSFPLESVRVPLLTKYGAYSDTEMYTVDDIEKIFRYARVRGIRVLLEMDAPAHAGNGWQWGRDFGMGDLAVCVNQAPWRQFCIQPPCGQLNPVNENLYSVLRDLYKDFADLMPRGEVLHMGGDEVFIGCWNSTPEIQRHLQERNLDFSKENYIRLWAEFQARVLDLWTEESGFKSPVILWSSELTQPAWITTYLDRERYVIQMWEKEGSPLTRQLLELGYKLILSPKDRWYLDHGFWGNTRYSSWGRMYEYEMDTDRGFEKQILGGEVAMWSEYVDGNVLDGRIWPRAAAVAERLWGPVGQAKPAEPRLMRHRNRLLARNLKPDPLGPTWCMQNDISCR